MKEIRVSKLDVFPAGFVGHILFEQGRDGIVAGVALEHGIVVQGNDLEEAQTRMLTAIEEWIERCLSENKPEEIFSKPSPKIRAKLERGRRHSVYEVVEQDPGVAASSNLWPMYQARVELRGSHRLAA